MAKQIQRFGKIILLFVALCSLYFLVRLLFFGHLPIFTDEAIYIRWAQIALRDANWRFISLTDGKQPLFVWIMMIWLKVIQDPLLAGRLVSVITGFFTMVGLMLLARELFKSKTITFLTALIYIFFPFAQVLDRMALYDSLVGCLGIYATYFSILLVKHIRLDLSYTLGFVLGAGLLNKSNALYNILFLPCSLLFFDLQKKDRKKQFMRWVLFIGIAVLIAEAMNSILRLSPLYGVIAQKNSTFFYPLSDWIYHPFRDFQSNFMGLSHWAYDYLSIPYMLLIVFALAIDRAYLKEKLFLFLYFLLGLVLMSLIGKVLFARYLFPFILSLIPLIAYSLHVFVTKLYRQWQPFSQAVFACLVTVLFLVYPAFVTIIFAIDPINAPITASDSGQYVNNWTAGWGVKESVVYLSEQAKDKKIYVATEGTFGLMPEAIELYLVDNPNVTIKGFWPFKQDEIPQEVLDAAKKMPTYFIYYEPQHQDLPNYLPLRLIQKTEQGKSRFYLRLYQVDLKRNVNHK